MKLLRKIICLLLATVMLTANVSAEVMSELFPPEDGAIIEELTGDIIEDPVVVEEESTEIIDDSLEISEEESTFDIEALPEFDISDIEDESELLGFSLFYFTGVYKVTSGSAIIRTGPSSKDSKHHTLAAGKSLDIIEIKKTNTGHYWGKTRQGRWTCIDNDNIDRVSGINKSGGKYEFKSGAVRRKGPADSYAGTSATAGEVISISEIHYNDYGNKWGLIDGGGTYKYVWMSNVSSHSCSYSAVKTTVEYKSKNEDKHTKYTHKTASKCKCGKVKSKATTEEKNYDHSYNLGKCTVCKHTFKLQYKDMGNKYYETINSSVPIRTLPFAEQSAYKYFPAGKVVKIKRSTTSDRGSKWLETTDGDWIYDGNMKKHSHDYENGICTNSTCRVKKEISVHTMDVTKFEITKDSVVARERPYGDESEVKETIKGKGKIVKIDGYCWNQYINKWYRTTDGYWIFEDNIKKHSDHNYSAGKCTNNGCNATFKLEEKKVGKQYEIIKDNVALRELPYSNTGGSRILNTGYVVTIDTKAKNSAKNWWYKTSDEGDWVFEDNIKVHKHKYVNGVCKNEGCGDLFELDIKTLSKTKTFYTNKLSVVSRKSPYQNGEIKETYKEFGTGITVDAKVENAAGNIWYRVEDEKAWIFEDNLSSHKHEYDSNSEGKCNKAFCGYEWPYKEISITPASYLVKSEEAPMWKRPYANSGKKDTKVKNDVITIVAKTTNCYGNLWYKDNRGIWIAGGHLTPKKDVVPESPTPGKVLKDKFLFEVKDAKGKAISGATVWLGDVSHPVDKNGNINVNLSTATYTLTVAAPGYETYTEKNFKMGKVHKKTITLGKAEKCEITNVELHYNNQVTDILKTTQKINTYNKNLSFSIVCKVSGKNAAIYRLCQGDKEVVSSASGNITNLNSKTFEKDKTVVLKVYDINKNLLDSKKLMLDVIYSAGDFPGEFSLGSSIKITLPDGAPKPIGGSTITIPLVKSWLDFQVDGEGNIRVGVGFPVLDSTEDGKPGWNQIKSMNAKKFKKFISLNKLKPTPAKGFEFSTDVGGYIEGNLNGKLLGKLFITASLDAYKEFQIPGSPIPLVFEVSFEGEATVDGTIQWTKVSGFELSTGLEVKVELGAYLGIGAAGLFSVGGYGKGQFGIDLRLSSETGGTMSAVWTDIVYGVKIKLCGKNVWSVQLGNAGKKYWVKNGVTLADVSEAEFSPFDMAFDLSEYTTMDRSYLENRSGWYPEDEITLAEELTDDDTDTVPGTVVPDYDFQALQLNSYTDIRPQVVALENVSMMIFADDDASRDINNRTKLVYSVYDDSVGKWSEPKAVWDDQTADYIFDVMSDGENIFVVWQNANKIFDGTEEIVDITKATDLYIAKYDEEADAFVNVERVTNNDKYEIFPSVSSGNDRIIVSWMENSADNPFGREGANTLKYSYKDSSKYPQSELIEEENPNDITPEEAGDSDFGEDAISPDYETEGTEEYNVWENAPWEITEYPLSEQYITSVSAGNLYEGDYIAYTVDGDGDYMTHEDSKILLLDLYDNTAIELTDRAINADFVPIHGDNTLTWYNEGKIYYLLDPYMAPQLICDETSIPADEYHIITDDNGDMAILYTLASETGSEAYMLKYEDINYEWGLPIKITEQDVYIKNFNGSYKNGKIIGVFNQITVDEELNEVNNLCTVTIGERHDLSLIDLDYDETNIVSGENDIEVTVKNNGNVKVPEINVKVYDEHEELIKEEVVEINLRVGDEATFKTQIVMPEEINMTTFKVVVEEAEVLDEKNSDNFEFFTIGLPVLSLELSSYTDDSDTIITADITNNGYDEAGGSIALFNEDDSIYSIVCENIEPLANGEMYSYSFAIDPAFFGGDMYKTVTVGIIANTEQYTDAYNRNTLYLRNPKEYDDATIDVSISGTAENDDEIELMEIPENEIESVIKNVTGADIENAQLLVIAYDEREIFKDIVYLEDISLSAGDTHSFSFDYDEEEIFSVKIVLIDKETLEPLLESTVLSEAREVKEVVVDPSIFVETVEY